MNIRKISSVSTHIARKDGAAEYEEPTGYKTNTIGSADDEKHQPYGDPKGKT
jgi:hypothetical protein